MDENGNVTYRLPVENRNKPWSAHVDFQPKKYKLPRAFTKAGPRASASSQTRQQPSLELQRLWSWLLCCPEWLIASAIRWRMRESTFRKR